MSMKMNRLFILVYLRHQIAFYFPTSEVQHFMPEKRWQNWQPVPLSACCKTGINQKFRILSFSFVDFHFSKTNLYVLKYRQNLILYILTALFVTGVTALLGFSYIERNSDPDTGDLRS